MDAGYFDHCCCMLLIASLSLLCHDASTRVCQYSVSFVYLLQLIL